MLGEIVPPDEAKTFVATKSLGEAPLVLLRDVRSRGSARIAFFAASLLRNSNMSRYFRSVSIEANFSPCISAMAKITQPRFSPDSDCDGADG